MVSEQTRNDVWDGLFDVKRCVRYYLALQKRNLLIERVLLVFLLVSGTTALGTVLAEAHQHIQIVFPAVIALVSFILLTGKYSAKATAAEWIARECEEQAIKWHNLYRDANEDRASESEVTKEFEELTKEIDSITAHSVTAGLTIHKRLNKRSATEANKDLLNTYA